MLIHSNNYSDTFQGSHELFESKFHDFSMTFHTSNFEIPGSKIKNEYNFTLSIYYTTDCNYIHF